MISGNGKIGGGLKALLAVGAVATAAPALACLALLGVGLRAVFAA